MLEVTDFYWRHFLGKKKKTQFWSLFVGAHPIRHHIFITFITYNTFIIQKLLRLIDYVPFHRVIKFRYKRCFRVKNKYFNLA